MELAALDQKKKIFYLLENYFKILAGSQVSDRCPLGYLFSFVVSVRILFESCGESKKFSFYVVPRLGGEFILFSFVHFKFHSTSRR